MRTVLTQDHATILRDLILTYGLDGDGSKIIDFSYGKGGYWKTDYPYKLKVTKTDSYPTNPDVIQKDIFTSDYSDLGLHRAGIFDPPYKYTKEVFNNQSIKSAQKQGPNSWGNDDRFSYNKTPQVFIDRVKSLDKVALQCIEPKGYLRVKVMDIRDGKGRLMLNHKMVIDNLTSFECYAVYIYISVGARTFKHKAETSHGYWMVFKKK